MLNFINVNNDSLYFNFKIRLKLMNAEHYLDGVNIFIPELDLYSCGL